MPVVVCTKVPVFIISQKKYYHKYFITTKNIFHQDLILMKDDLKLRKITTVVVTTGQGIMINNEIIQDNVFKTFHPPIDAAEINMELCSNNVDEKINLSITFHLK